MKKFIFVSSLVALLATSASGAVPTIGQSYIAGNADKTMWDVSDVPHVGTILRVTRDGHGHILTVQKYSDWIAEHLPDTVLETANGLNQSITVTRTTNVSIGISLLKMIGIDVNGGIDKTSTAGITFTNVKIRQRKALLPFLTAIQRMDEAGYKKDDQGSDLFALISGETSKKLRNRVDRSQFWIVTHVYTPETVIWTVDGKKNQNLTVKCSALSDQCGKIAASGGRTVTGTRSGNDVALYIVAKPLYTVQGTIRIGQIPPRDAPARISG